MSTLDTEPIPFCQQNIRLWILLLVISGALVLGFAVWLATKSSDFHGFKLRAEGGGANAAAHGAHGGGGGPRVGGVGGGAGRQVAFVQPMGAPGSAGSSGPVQVAQRAGQGGAHLHPSFNRAADIIRPCVVNINAVRPSAPVQVQAAAPQFVDPFDGVPDKMFGQMAFESVGSGVIVDPSGYIVTNDHLVAGATAIMITRYNQGNEHLPARLVLSDRQNDLALLKLEGRGPYPAATLADSNRVEVGDWVLAVGNPFGLGHTVTAGIISGRRASLVIAGVEYRGLLQTDAPINQGSSGGPLVNLEGQVVGINTAIYAPTGVFNGTGFAIPSSRVGAFLARAMPGNLQPAAQVQQGAGAPRSAGYLGVGVIDMSPALAAKIACPLSTGAFVSSVTPGSPAAEAEISRGDVITAVAGRPVQGARSLSTVLSSFMPGQTLPVSVWRNGKMRTMNVKVFASPLAVR